MNNFLFSFFFLSISLSVFHVSILGIEFDYFPIIKFAYYSQLPQSELSKMASIGDGSSKQNSSFDFVLPRRVEKGEQHENNKLSDIEQLVKRTKFTRYIN